MFALLGSTSSARSISTQQKLQRQFDQTSERLSTGARINRGADGPAGLIASSKLRNERVGAESAQLGASRARAAVATAEQALGEVQDHVRRINQLVLAADSSRSAQEVRASQTEIDALVSQIDRVLDDARFAGKPLFRGDPVIEPDPLPPGVPFTFRNNFNATGSTSIVNSPDVVTTSDGSGLSSSGTDSFSMYTSRYEGDATGAANISARLAELGRQGGGTPDAGWQAGVIVRNFYTDRSPFVSLAYEQGQGIVLQQRENTSGPITRQLGPDLGDNVHLRLQRSGTQVSAEYSTNGTEWVQAFPPVDLVPALIVPRLAYGVFASAGGTGNGFVEADFKDVQVRPGNLPLIRNLSERPDPDSGTLAGDPPEAASQTAFTFALGSAQPRGLAALRFETTRAADLGDAAASLLDLTSGGSLALTQDGPTEQAQLALNAAMDRLSAMRGHAGRFEKFVIDPAASAASEASIQLADADATVRETNVAEDVAERSRLGVLQQSAQRAMQVMFDVSRQQVEELI